MEHENFSYRLFSWPRGVVRIQKAKASEKLGWITRSCCPWVCSDGPFSPDKVTVPR